MQKEMRFALAEEKGADATCPFTKGIFLRIAIEERLSQSMGRTPSHCSGLDAEKLHLKVK